jgi:hypothetical protein
MFTPEKFPISNSHWKETEDLSLFDAALLSFGVDPLSVREHCELRELQADETEFPAGMTLRLRALQSAVRTGKIALTVQHFAESDTYDVHDSRIAKESFLTWCNGKGLNLHNLSPVNHLPPAKWPWGNHDTPALMALLDAAKQWWSTYDPADFSTAPRNKEVESWLISEKGQPKRIAEAMATILRAEGVRTGPRPKKLSE